ncbi:MAG: prepilin-type N-terminal cleavage/methylation domain-containing protein [Halomonas sp.]|nr:prepilin-type N-terminal cleavage/methylation domain-containing protein [Halomonas sp.]
MKPLRFQKGFSLVELMVAMAVGIIIVLGASQLFLTSKNIYERNAGLAERQERLRFLSDVLSRDIRMADSAGLIVNADKDVLAIEYSGSRKSDPYCAPGEELTQAEYSLDAMTINVAYACNDEPLNAPQPLVNGVEALHFPKGGNGASFVDVLLRFPALEKELEASREVQFRVANRAAIITAIN